MQKAWKVLLPIMVLALLAGCPAGEEEGKATEEPQASPAAESGESSSAAVPEVPELPDDPGVGRLDLDGVKLGMHSMTVLMRYSKEGEMKPMINWAEQGVAGMINAMPSDGRMLPAESAIIGDGKVIGFMRTLEGVQQDFEKWRNDADERFGQHEGVMPSWAAESEFGTKLRPPASEDQVAYWGDEESRAVLVCTYKPKEARLMIMLVHADRFIEGMAKANQPPPRQQPAP